MYMIDHFYFNANLLHYYGYYFFIELKIKCLSPINNSIITYLNINIIKQIKVRKDLNVLKLKSLNML